MKVIVSVFDLCAHLKLNTLAHVHYKIENARDNFLEHRCPHTFMRDVRMITEVSNLCIVEYIRTVKTRTDASVTEFARVYDRV